MGRVLFMALILALTMFAAPGGGARAETVLRVFIGGAMRAETMRAVAEAYARVNPAVRVEVETGGGNVEQQQQMLNASLSGREPVLDVLLVDVTRIAQFAAAQWAEPLDAHLGAEKEALAARFFPALRQAGMAGGRTIGLPVFADALFLYYRRDLLQKYGIAPPATWAELKQAVLTILQGENNPALRGLELAGSPAESTICTLLLPIWGAGEEMVGANGFDAAATRRGLDLLLDLKAAKVLPPGVAEAGIDRARQAFQSGQAVFALGWGYAYPRFENEAGSAVRGQVGIAAPPGVSAERAASCLGGWLATVSSFSRSKAEAAQFAKFLASAEAGRILALQGGHLPAIAALHAEPEIAARPEFAAAARVLPLARARPASPRYPDLSALLRGQASAVLGGARTPEAAIGELAAKLPAILR